MIGLGRLSCRGNGWMRAPCLGLGESLAEALPGYRQGRLAAAGGLIEEGAEPVADGGEQVLDLGFGEMADLAGDGCDDAAGAHDRVGCPGDAVRVQQVRDGVVGELVVRWPDDRAAAERGHGLRG